MKTSFETRKNVLFTILSGIFITNALLAEIIGTKIFSLEATFGLPPADLVIFENHMSFSLTAGAVLWPIVFITSDLINEYFGRPGVKRISFFTAILIGYAFLAIFMAMKLSPASFWLETYTHDTQGNRFNIDFAFNTIFGQGLRIIIGSIVAFLIGQLLDVYVFHQFRKMTGAKKLWLRATGSTLISQLVDSFVVLFIAFYGTFRTENIIAIGITNYIYKFSIAIALTPLIYLGHYWIDIYLGKDKAKQLTEEASQQSNSLI